MSWGSVLTGKSFQIRPLKRTIVFKKGQAISRHPGSDPGGGTRERPFYVHSRGGSIPDGDAFTPAVRSSHEAIRGHDDRVDAGVLVDQLHVVPLGFKGGFPALRLGSGLQLGRAVA